MGMMGRRTRARALVVVAGLVLAACGAGSDEGATDAATGTLVRTTQGELGAFLTDADGMTLYLFTNDDPGVSNCTGDCLAAWPALLTGGDPVAGDGIDASLLGTTTRDDGSVQVTYADRPLYYFAGDTGAGDLAGQGVNDVWFVVSPDGEMFGGASAPEEPMGGGGGGPSSGTGGGYEY